MQKLKLLFWVLCDGNHACTVQRSNLCVRPENSLGFVLFYKILSGGKRYITLRDLVEKGKKQQCLDCRLYV